MKTFSPKKEAFFLALSHRIVPEIALLDQNGRERFLQIVDDTLATRPALVQRQFRFFLSILRISSIPRHFKTLDRLPPDRQDRILSRFQHSSNNLLRRGFWGLKTLIFMGYYGQPEVARRIRYTPSPRGNEML